jgi:hypothetical protein
VKRKPTRIPTQKTNRVAHPHLVVNHAAAGQITKHRATSNKFTVNCATRHETFDGRDHLVAPVVAVKEGVLNGMLVLYDEFAAYPAAWEGIPLPIYHPEKSSQRVSANTPDILQKQVIGRMFNVQADPTSKALKGELWIDVEKAKQTDDGKEILRRMETEGQQLEVSTGYFSDLELASGYYQGKPYDSIQRNMRPDHLALLPGAKGACNWMDGCGAPRINQPVTNAVKYLAKAGDAQHLPVTDDAGKPDPRLMGAAWAALHGGYRGNKYTGPGKAKAIAKLKAMYKKENMDTPTANEKEITRFCLTAANQNDYSHDDIASMIREALMEEDQGCYYYLSDVYDDFFIYTAEMKMYVPPPASPAGLFKRSYTLTDGDLQLGDATPVVRKTSYVDQPTGNKEPDMKKDEIINKLISDPNTTWKEEHRAMMGNISEAELLRLLPVDPAEEKRRETVNSLIAHQGTSWKEEHRSVLMQLNQAELDRMLPAPAATVAAPAAAATRPAFANRAEFLSAIGDVSTRQVFEGVLAENDRQRQAIIATLVANKSCKFSKEELEGMDFNFLLKVADTMNVNYAGQAPPRYPDRARVENEFDGVPEAPKFLTRPVETETKK